MPINFQYFSPLRLSRAFVIDVPLNIPPHLKRVATLPCEMFYTFLTHSGQWPVFLRHRVFEH